MAYELTVKTEFSAAHNLRAYRGKCEHLHGHNWTVELRVQGERLNDEGMLMDFVEIKRLLALVLDPFDHAYLNETPPFDRENPSSENLSRYIALAVGARLPVGITVESVTTWESDRCSATYRPGPDAGQEA